MRWGYLLALTLLVVASWNYRGCSGEVQDEEKEEQIRHESETPEPPTRFA